MNDDFQEDLKFEAADDAADEGQGLFLDIDGYEGPLHLLLELARQQKVDLTRISILELAEQYIDFIKTAKDLRIELAADYLVMASWLAYLEAMRRAADGLFSLPQTGQAVFRHGQAAGLRSRTTPLYGAELFDVLRAYGESRSKTAIRNHKVPKPLVMSLEDARNRLKRAVKALGDSHSGWIELDGLLPTESDFSDAIPQKSILASSLLAGLELAKDGDLELRQSEAFKPIYVRGTLKPAVGEG